MTAVKSQSGSPVSLVRRSLGEGGRRRRTVFLPAVELDLQSATPLYHQLSRQIATAVTRDGKVGDCLPSTRLLARLLGLSRNTVVTAYELLVADGVIEGRIGSRMTIADRRAPAVATPRFDPQRLMRDAMYPAQTVAVEDPDGAALYLVY
jgi:DNA-binding transcriptional regulator YhcF (GntR family)